MSTCVCWTANNICVKMLRPVLFSSVSKFRSCLHLSTSACYTPTNIPVKVVKARKYIVVKQFVGFPKRDDYNIVEEELPPLKDGEILVKAEFVSVDPYMRLFQASFAGGKSTPYDQFGFQVARVVESKDTKFPVGSRVVSHVGWRDYSILNPGAGGEPGKKPYALPELGSLPASLGVGAVGMPGATAYFGFLKICDPKPGETVVVSGAAGAVGSIVGQIAKIKGCKVIGFAGSDGKVKLLKEQYGFDDAINYNSAVIAQKLRQFAPNGVDCYFDNVGGELSSTIISQMNLYGRVSVCGIVSIYNNDVTLLPKATILQPALWMKELTIKGFRIWSFAEHMPEAYKELAQWIREGKLKAPEHVTEGFDNIFDAFVGMLNGDNVGKAVVKV